MKRRGLGVSAVALAPYAPLHASVYRPRRVVAIDPLKVFFYGVPMALGEMRGGAWFACWSRWGQA